MTIVDVASLGVRIEAEGVDSTQAALRGIEAQGERVSRAVGNLTARVSVTGTDTVAASVRRISETVAGVTTSSAAATRAVTTDAAARSAALAKEAESAERAARRAEEAVQRRQAAVERAHAAESAAVRVAGGEPAGVDPAVRRASDRAEQQLDTAQRKAADLQAAASRAREAAEAAARAMPAAPLAPVVSAAPVAERAVRTVKAAADATAASFGEMEARARAAMRAADPMSRAAPVTLAAIPRDQSGLLERQSAPVLGAQPVPPRDHNVAGHIPGLDDLGRESADAAAAQQTLAKDARAAADALSAEERRIASIIASVEDMATSIDVASSRQVASFRANARAAGEYLETIHAGEQAAERIADAMLNVTTRAAQAAAAPRLPPPSASPSSRPVDDEGGTAAIRRRVAMLEQATRIESTRSEALVRLGGVEAGLARALERTNLTLQQRVTLEQLLARTQTAGRSAPPPSSFGTADTGALSRRIALLTQGTQVDATFAESVTKLTGVQGGLEAALRRSNLTLEQRIALGGQLARVNGALDAASGKSAATLDKSGTTAQVAGSKFRSAANGLTAMAFAATAGGSSMQGLALAAGLAASSLAEIGGKAAATAGAIGAGITVFAAFVGVLEQIRQKRQQLARENLLDPRFTRSADDAERNVAQLDRQIGLLQDRIQGLNRFTAGLPGGMGLEGWFFGQANALRQRLADVQALRAEADRAQRAPKAAEEAEQRRQAVVGGLQAENTAVAAAADAQLAAHRIRYDQGRSDLASYTDARVASIRAGAAREIDELRAQQRALRDDTGREPGKIGTTETKAARDARLAEATQLDSAIRAVRNRAAGEEQQAAADRESQARALRDRLIGYEIEVATARGDQARATALRIQQQAEAQQRTLAQQVGGATPDAQRQAAEYRATLELAADAAEAQRVLAREQNALGAKRAEIQAQVTKGTLTEVDGQRAIAAAERERLPALTAQLAILERIALALGNPDLLAFVRQVRGELAGWGDAVSPLQARLNGIVNDLKSRGSAAAADLGKRIQEAVAKAGGVVTLGIVVKAEGLANLEAEAAMIGKNVAGALGNAISAGLSAIGQGANGNSAFRQFGAALLQGFGQVLTSLGQMALMAAIPLAAIRKALLSMNPYAMAAAGVALIGLGALVGGMGARALGGLNGGGGGGGSISAPASFDQSASVILTPRAAGKAPAPQPIVQIGNVTVMNPNDPSWQRQLSESVQGGVRRGLKFGMAGT